MSSSSVQPPPCPSCGDPRPLRHGVVSGRQRWRCRECQRTYSASTGTALAGVHSRGVVADWHELTERGLGVRLTARAVGISDSTAWRWRARFSGSSPAYEPSAAMVSPTVIDLFAGAGGMSSGFNSAGYRVVAAIENWDVAAASFRAAHPSAAVIVAPVETVSGRRLLRSAGLVRGECFVMVGGPPCPPYSSLSASRLTEDGRKELWREYLRLVDAVLPKWVVIENVPGLLSNGDAIGGIRSAFLAMGYAVDARVLDAVDFGAPQFRRRAVIIGRRGGGAIRFPEPTYGDGRLPYMTAGNALNAPMDAETTAAEIPALSPLAVERLSYIRQGESVWDAMPRLPDHLKIKGSGFPSSIYRRLSPGEPSYTVVGNGGGGTLIYHWRDDRALSNRERARLQGFADNHGFHGSSVDVRAQIGNAVPPPLARAIALALRSA